MSQTDNLFDDYDDLDVYNKVQTWLQSPNARNFVIEFGQNEARIARDVDTANFESLVNHEGVDESAARPVRWINIWGPDKQPGMIDVIAGRYAISYRLRAILKSSPPPKSRPEEPPVAVQAETATANGIPRNDVEQANGTIEKPQVKRAEGPEDKNHYAIARNLVNYQSLDLGEKFICIGANWMYEVNGVVERLWSWLILCDDCTVISLYEDIRPLEQTEDYMKAVREHIGTVLSQLSANDAENGGSMSLVSVRKIFKSDSSHDGDGSEVSSNLYYYLFDNWRRSYQMITENQRRLAHLSGKILSVIGQKHQKEPDLTIIPSLYEIGKHLRSNQHLYKSYRNTIERVLKYRIGTQSQSSKRVTIALSASERFERLGDRIDLLVLSSIDEAIAEKDALLSTYFQITAQKDSAATAKLSRNATLLSKLGVLFLPVSLVTSYFSTQITDLQNIYTAKTYWITFAVVMAISIIALFFLSRVLVSVTESLEARVTRSSRWFKAKFPRMQPRKLVKKTS